MVEIPHWFCVIALFEQEKCRLTLTSAALIKKCHVSFDSRTYSDKFYSIFTETFSYSRSAEGTCFCTKEQLCKEEHNLIQQLYPGFCRACKSKWFFGGFLFCRKEKEKKSRKACTKRVFLFKEALQQTKLSLPYFVVTKFCKFMAKLYFLYSQPDAW